MKITKHTTYTAEINNVTVPLTFQPVGHPEPLAAKSGDRLVIVYAVQDDHLPVEDLIGDGMGKLLSLHRHDKTRGQALAALGLDQYGEFDPDLRTDKDGVLLDCYEHGEQHWSISGKGTQCRFDTARGAGVWVPDDCLRSQLDADEREGKDRRAQAVLYAQQFLEQYNAIINGEVYGIVTEIYDEHGGFISCDHCWGYVGSEGTAEEMKLWHWGHGGGDGDIIVIHLTEAAAIAHAEALLSFTRSDK